MQPNEGLFHTRGEQEGVSQRRLTVLESAALLDGREAWNGEVPGGIGVGKRLLPQGKASERSDNAPEGPGLGVKELRALVQDDAAGPRQRLRFDSPPPAWRECCSHGT